MKYITVLLLAVFLIPFVPNVHAQDIMDQITGGIQDLTGGAGQSANNTSDGYGQTFSIRNTESITVQEYRSSRNVKE